MSQIDIICPVCEKDVAIQEREIKLAVRSTKKTGGKALVWCPECCRVLVLPPEVPNGDVALEEWIVNVEDPDCVPFLDSEVVKMPAGKVDQLGKVTYRPGDGGRLLTERDYMLTYGVNPRCMLLKMRPEQEPVKLGGFR